MTTGAWFDPLSGRVRLLPAEAPPARPRAAAWPWRRRRSLLTPTQKHRERVAAELAARIAELDAAIAVAEAEEHLEEAAA